MSLHPTTPLRIVVVCPSWVGDAVMATPALGLIRRSLPGATIGAFCKPGVAPILDGLDVYDELITMHPGGVMGHKHSASKLRMRGYDTVLLLTNSFSTALIARMAGAPRRIGYDRDARHLLLTHRLTAPKTDEGKWAIVPAVDYYWHAAETLIAMTTGSALSQMRSWFGRCHRHRAGAQKGYPSRRAIQVAAGAVSARVHVVAAAQEQVQFVAQLYHRPHRVCH